MKKLYFLKTMLLLCALVAGSSSVWAQSDYSEDYSSGSSFTSVITGQKVTIGTTDYDAAKRGTGNAAGSMTIKVPKSTKYLHLHAAGWNNETVTLSITPNTYSKTKSISLTSDSKVSGNGSTYDIDDTKCATDYYKVITFESALTADISFTFSATSGKRFVIWGVNAEGESVNVNNLSITTAPTKTRYEVGEKLDMTGFKLDADGNEVTSGYTMKIDNVAVSDGVSTLSTAGKKTIVVSYGGKSVNQEISVGAVTGISITNPPTKTIYSDGETFSTDGMVVTASLSTGDENPDTWTKTVTGYTISPNGALSTTDTKVTITYAGQTAEQNITVNPIAVTGVDLTSAVTIEKDKTKTLTPTFTPTNATNKAVSWESDNTSVATVSAAGIVTAVSVGTANITVTTEDGGFTATCVVTVVTKKGDIDNPYTVADVIGQQSATTFGNGVYVTGYIVGSVKDNKCYKTTTANFVNTNLLLADTPDVSFSEGVNIANTSGIIPVELPSTNNGVLRTNWGPSNKPYNIGVAKVVIKGNCETYFSTKGIKGTSEITKVAERVNISSAGMATYYTDSALDFSEFTDMYAYTAAVSGDKVNFNRVNKVPANTAVLLRNPDGAIAASHDVPVTDSPESVTSDLTGTLTNIASLATTSGSNTNYILNTGDNGVGFYYANGLPVGMHKAYLTVTAGARTFIGFDNETDGVDAALVNSEERTVNSEVYDLQGLRVESSIFNSQSSILKKGLYIVNGKKVIK